MTNRPDISRGYTDSRHFQEEAIEQIDRELETWIPQLDRSAPLLSRMTSYHLGLVNPAGETIAADDRRRFQGKRFRPMIALMSCVAAGGTIEDAAPLAAAIELLHNFTLIHDDVQDRSPNRRHRATVWRIWGDAQAINAGDALFAVAQLAILNIPSTGVDSDKVVAISQQFNRTTIEIVRGQVLDIDFEGRDDIGPDDYLAMIERKTAAIVEFAAWSGATLGGADSGTAETFGRFGKALGVGFQIQDDALGVWGASEETGKDTGDDIRGHKQSLPLLLLRAAADTRDSKALDSIFGGDRIAEDDVMAVLSMLAKYRIADDVASSVRWYHDDAIAALDALTDLQDSVALRSLRSLTDGLASRSA